MLQQLKKLRQLSLAAYITGLFCLMLLLLIAIAWTVFQFDPARVAWSDYMTLRRGLILTTLFLGTSAAIYFSARLWLDEVPARADDVEAAWRNGLTALNKVGISVRELPVFLLVGATSVQQQRQLVTSSNQQLLVDAASVGNAPLNWFATDQAIYLCVASAGLVGKTLENLQRSRSDLFGVDEPLCDLNEPVMIAAADATAEVPPEPAPPTADDATDAAAASPLPSHAADGGAGTATLVRKSPSETKTELQVEQQLDQLESLIAAQLPQGNVHAAEAQSLRSARLSPLTSTEIAAAQNTLADVCGRLRGQRRPVAAVNGVVVVIDVGVAMRCESAARHCGAAIQADLEQIGHTLGQYAPVSLILTGMERQPGVREAIRRLGANRAGLVTLGQSCDPRETCQTSMVETTVDRALQSIDDLVHFLLRAPDAVSMPGNQQLIQLLIEGRQRYHRPLKVLLGQTLANKTLNQSCTAGFFNGLFFAASGESPLERAFMQPIFQRLQAQQHWLAWSPDELRRQRQERLLTWGLKLLCCGEAVWLILQLVL